MNVFDQRIPRPTDIVAGTNVTIVDTGITKTVSSSGGGGTWTIIEVNLGGPTWRGSFSVIDGTVTGLSRIVIIQAAGPYTGKGTLPDESEMDPIWCVTQPKGGQFTVYWQTFPQYVPIIYGLSGGDGGKQATGLPILGQLGVFDIVGMRRIGKVKGNVKFIYQVT